MLVHLGDLVNGDPLQQKWLYLWRVTSTKKPEIFLILSQVLLKMVKAVFFLVYQMLTLLIEHTCGLVFLPFISVACSWAGATFSVLIIHWAHYDSLGQIFIIVITGSKYFSIRTNGRYYIRCRECRLWIMVPVLKKHGIKLQRRDVYVYICTHIWKDNSMGNICGLRNELYR